MKVPSLLQAIAAALLMAALPAAHGTPTLGYSVDGGAPVFCEDQDAACDLNPAVGAVTVIDDFGGGFTINVVTGITKPAATGDTLMDLNFVTTQQTNDPHTLLLGFSETDFLLEGTISGLIGGTTSGTVDAAACYDETNVLFSCDVLIGEFGPFAGAFADTFAGLATGDTPYSLTQFVLITTTSAGATSGDFELRLVPEPGTLALMGLGLLGLAAFRRRQPQ